MDIYEISILRRVRNRVEKGIESFDHILPQVEVVVNGLANQEWFKEPLAYESLGLENGLLAVFFIIDLLVNSISRDFKIFDEWHCGLN